MPDRYIDETYVEDILGTAYVNAVQAVSGTDLNVMIESATGQVQGALASAGYATPTTTSDERVKSATLAHVRVLLANVPEGAIPLPEGWADNPLNPLAVLDRIIDGRLPILGHSLTTATAVGGWTMTPRTGTDGRPPRANPDDLAGH